MLAHIYFDFIILSITFLITINCSDLQAQTEGKGNVESIKGDLLTYLGRKAPSDTPAIFAQDFISLPMRYEFGAVFNREATELYFGVTNRGKSSIWFTQLQQDAWTEPEPLLEHPTYSFNDPMLSPDEQRLYFISDMPLDKKGEKKDVDIWYVEAGKKEWHQAINPGAPINSARNEYFISFTKNGHAYFGSNRNAATETLFNYDIYRCKRTKDGYENAVKLPATINSKGYEADVFIAPDEKYIIFSSSRKDGMGQGDLYISFKAEQGWREARNLGKKINDENHQLCPFVTRDGKYFIYTSNQDIYWIEADFLRQFDE